MIIRFLKWLAYKRGYRLFSLKYDREVNELYPQMKDIRISFAELEAAYLFAAKEKESGAAAITRFMPSIDYPHARVWAVSIYVLLKESNENITTAI